MGIILIKIAKSLIHTLHASVNIPREDFLPSRTLVIAVFCLISRDKTKPAEFRLVELPVIAAPSVKVRRSQVAPKSQCQATTPLPLQQLQGLHLRSPFKCCLELGLGLGDITVIRIQVLLEDDLRRNVRVGGGECDAPNFGMAGRCDEFGDR